MRKHPTITARGLLRPVLAAVLAWVAPQGAWAAEAVDCGAAFQAAARTLPALTWQTFDQDPASGWRQLDARGCRVEALRLMQRFIAIEQSRINTVRWHMAQNLALLGRSAESIEQARQTLMPADEAASAAAAGFDWNAYVNGTIAFLEGRFDALPALARQLERHPNDAANARILRRLERCAGKSYQEAMESPACGAEAGGDGDAGRS